MRYADKFTQEEIELTNKLLNQYYNPHVHKDIPLLIYFLNEWNIRTEEFEKGYTLTIDDYKNEISVRDILDSLIKEADENLKLKLNTILKPVDEKFKNVTNDIQEPLMIGSNGEKPEWWWYRIPKKLVGELKEDVEKLQLN